MSTYRNAGKSDWRLNLPKCKASNGAEKSWSAINETICGQCTLNLLISHWKGALETKALLIPLFIFFVGQMISTFFNADKLYTLLSTGSFNIMKIMVFSNHLQKFFNFFLLLCCLLTFLFFLIKYYYENSRHKEKSFLNLEF